MGSEDRGQAREAGGFGYGRLRQVPHMPSFAPPNSSACSQRVAVLLARWGRPFGQRRRPPEGDDVDAVHLGVRGKLGVDVEEDLFGRGKGGSGGPSSAACEFGLPVCAALQRVNAPLLLAAPCSGRASAPAERGRQPAQPSPAQPAPAHAPACRSSRAAAASAPAARRAHQAAPQVNKTRWSRLALPRFCPPTVWAPPAESTPSQLPGAAPGTLPAKPVPLLASKQKHWILLKYWPACCGATL